MIELTIGCGHGHPELRPMRLLAGAASLRDLLRDIARNLHHSWHDVLTDQPIGEIDARLLRDIGLSECAAERAVASTSSLGMADCFAIPGLGPRFGPFPRQVPDRLCASACPPNGPGQCHAAQAEPK